MGIALWITGLPGSGKSTYADGLKRKNPEFIVLRMDELRRVATPEPKYSEEERDILYRSLVFMAKTLTEAGSDVIIDATGNLIRWRLLARRLIPEYSEVYLKCPIEVCMQRERKRTDAYCAPHDIYEKGRMGWPVPGITAPYEEPLNPEITINTDSASLEEGLGMISGFIEKLRRKQKVDCA